MKKVAKMTAKEARDELAKLELLAKHKLGTLTEGERTKLSRLTVASPSTRLTLKKGKIIPEFRREIMPERKGKNARLPLPKLSKKAKKEIKEAKRAMKRAARLVSVDAPTTKKEAKRIARERQAEMERSGVKRAVAKEILRAEQEGKANGLIPGMLVQYYDGGLRAGYVADIPSDNAVKIQPIGPRGHEEWTPKHVRLESVLQNELTQRSNINMATVAKKASELKSLAAKSAAAKTSNAKQAVKNLKNGNGKSAKKANGAAKKTASRDRFDSDAVIKLLAGSKNPRREGTKAYKDFEMYGKSGMTVGKYRDAGGDMGYLKNDFLKRHLIKIG